MLPVPNQFFVSPARQSPWLLGLLGLLLLINTPEQILAWDPLLTCRGPGAALSSVCKSQAGHHLPPQIFCSFLFLFSSQTMIFFFHGTLQPSSSPTDIPPSYMGWVILRVNHLPLVDPTLWYLVWDFGSNYIVVNPCNSCKGGVLEFGVFLLLILANYGTE